MLTPESLLKPRQGPTNVPVSLIIRSRVVKRIFALSAVRASCCRLEPMRRVGSVDTEPGGAERCTQLHIVQAGDRQLKQLRLFLGGAASLTSCHP